MSPLAAELAFAAALLALPATLPAQDEPVPTLHVAIADASSRGRLPALAWACEHWMPHQPWWPADVDPRGALRLSLTGGRPHIARLGQPPDDGVACHGTLTCGDGPAIHFACALDGVEDWIVPADVVVPRPWREALQRLDACALHTPRTLDLAVVAGHLAGALADGDPLAALVQLGAMRCGEVTWTSWAGDGHLRVRGRSDGGLWLPAALLALASGNGKGWNGLTVRAHGSNSGDQLEAVRQLAASDAVSARTVLRAMLHADDAARAAAIDALVRTGAADELPAIVAAATPDAPWATLAAVDAVPALWDSASNEVRERTRRAIAQSHTLAVRAIDPRPTTDAESVPTVAPLATRLVFWLAASALGLFWLWQRDRIRPAPCAD